MSIHIRNNDLVLRFRDDKIEDILNKYDTYLETLYNEDYSFHRDAVKAAVGFLLSDKYKTLEELAKENYLNNPKIKDRYPTKDDYLSAIPLGKFKSCSMDLATGSGKSFLLFGIAQVMLCENTVDKVLILCPSLTIEDGLTEKFKDLNSRKELVDILRAINKDFIQPQIKNASETIQANDICIENIHATYQRTGSSIQSSFKNEGQNVLVMNDEAHHIFSGEADSKDKKWIEFLKDKDFNFKYIVNVTGTPYYGPDNNDYFNDVIFRFGLKQAVDRGIVKKVDAKTFDEYKEDKGYQQIWAVHQENINAYGKYLKPISIVICASIAEAIIEWNELVIFISMKEKIEFNEAAEKVIWVTSGLPSNTSNEGQRIAPILAKVKNKRNGETIRNLNLKLLQTVDDKENPVEWIVSVSMLTEGWDVKNVFQVVPHKQRAFNSKLLIAQVLGRGLRMPQALKEAIGADKIFLKVNNHEKWNAQIQNLYNEILELDNRLSWGYDKSRSEYSFILHNLKYEPQETSTETKKEKAQAPKSFGFNPQRKISDYIVDFQHNKSISYVYEENTGYEIDVAVTNLHAYLKDKDPKLALEYPKTKLKRAIQKELQDKGYEDNFLSRENYNSAQQSFGPIFRELGKKVPRVQNIAMDLFEINMKDYPTLSFSEDSLKRNGFLYYTDKTLNWITKDDEKSLLKQFTNLEIEIAELTKELGNFELDTVAIASKIAELAILKKEINQHIEKIDDSIFKTSLSSLYVSYLPEIQFTKSLFGNIELIDGFIKSADKGFYSFPYSYKPEAKGKTHVKNETFNPDFFLKLKGKSDIIVVEIKKEGDDSPKNKAKFRDAKIHFENLNKKLEAEGKSERYYFKILSDDGSDIADFFNSVQSGNYKKWYSTLMNQLEQGD